MKFEGIGFNMKRLKEMPRAEFDQNVAHLLPAAKADELYVILHASKDEIKEIINIINDGNDQKLTTVVGAAESTEGHSDEPTDHAA